MEHYVTLFDSLFLPQGLALHASLERHAGPYVLWVLCVDDAAFQNLERLQLPSCRLLRLADVETPELLAVKSGRTIGEYCWTLTPFAPEFVFAADTTVPRVTYLDADMWFLRSPRPIFDEFERSAAQALITRHGYAPEYDQSATAGRYCVQFMTFTREGGWPIRRWWQQRCLEWCFAKYEEGRFGDQKYLDDWPERFGSLVHVLQQQELAQAPWNSMRFPYSDAVFFHFHGLRIAPERRVDLGMYYVPKRTLNHVYAPYIAELGRSVAALEGIDWKVRPQRSPITLWQRTHRALSAIYRELWRFRQLQGMKY